MTKKLSLLSALLVGGATIFIGASMTFAAHPAGPAGYWAFDEGAGVAALDGSGHGNNGVIVGGAAYAAGALTPSNTSALTFDGADDHVQVADNTELDTTGELSMSGWVKTFNSDTQVLARKTFAYEVLIYNGHLAALLGDGAAWSGANIVEGAVNIADGNWHHVAMTYDDASDTLKLYVDGVLDVANAAYPVSLGANAYDLYLGAWNDGTGSGFYLSGDLDETQLYSRVLGLDEIEILSDTGNTHFVDDDGEIGFGSIDCDGVGVGAYSAIQDAVDAANSGETVYVCPGIYDEQVVIDGKDLTLQGAGDTTIIQPSAPAILAELYTYPVGVLPGWVGVVLAPIVLVENADTATVRDILIDGTNVTSLPAGAGRLSGILFGESGGTISDVTLNSIKTTGYADRTYVIDVSAVGSARAVEVANNTINDYARTAIQVQGASLTANVHDNDITGPGMIGPANVPNGIVFIQNAVGVASDNTIHALHYTGVDSLSAGLMAYEATGAAGVLFQNNEVYDTDDAVILALNSTNVTVEGNNLHNNVKGIRIEGGATGNSISSNLIDANTSFGIDVDDDPATPGNIASRNSITGNGAGVSNPNASNFDATCNWWGDASGPGPVGPGTGDTVSANVDYSTWLTTSDLNGPCDGPLTTLTVVKTVENDNGGTKVVADFVLSVGDGNATTTVASGATTTLSANVEYTVSETSQAGYTASAWGGDCAADGVITLTEGQTATCTITNDDNAPSLTLQKVVINDNGGSATVTDWTVSATGPTGFSGSGPIVANGPSFDAGTYDLSEVGPAGYTASDWVCVNGNQTDGDTVEIGLGENVLCTITNNDTPPPTPPANACETPLVAPLGYTLINGAPGNDNVLLAPFTMFVGNGGNDKVRAGSGDYIICLGGGKDTVTLNGSGAVTIDAGDGNNTITAMGTVAGYVKTGSGKDKITFGSGERTIIAGDGDNTVTALGSGNQTITTGSGTDKITTGSGNDTIVAGNGKNTVVAGIGDDSLTGGADKDILNGGPGTDTCNAGGGTNTVVGCEL